MKKYISFAISLLVVMYCSLNKAKGQTTSGPPLNINTPSGCCDYLGWNGTVTVPLQIRTQANYPINFYTDSIFRVIIDKSTGYVGMGYYFNATSPAYLLDVDSGDINIGHDARTDSFGYRIGHNYVLWNNGNVRNIYVGVNAGKANAAASAINNTFCGYDVGNMDSTGFSNSFNA